MQNLWADSSTGSAKLGPAAEVLRAGLRRSVGTLLGQLYDRNTRRSFAPVEAFQAQGLPKGQSAAAASAQAAGWLTDAGTTHGRIGAVLRCAPKIKADQVAWDMPTFTAPCDGKQLSNSPSDQTIVLQEMQVPA